MLLASRLFQSVVYNLALNFEIYAASTNDG
jgi:hypothetical protein